MHTVLNYNTSVSDSMVICLVIVAVGKLRNVECGMKTVERCCGTVGKMRNAEIAYVDDRMSTGGHSYFL